MIRWLITIVAILFMTTGCTHFPEADTTAAVAQKKSVIVLTADGLDPQTTQLIKQTVQSWRQTDKIAYDLYSDLQSIDEPLLQKWAGMPVDQIVVIGNELIKQGEQAAKRLPDIKWTWLQTEPSKSGLITVNLPNVRLRTLDLTSAFQSWNPWVRDQMAAGGTILWLTRSGYSVPSSWAPSEESAQIVDLDVYRDQWYSQLTAQVKAITATHIVVYGPLEQTELTRLKSIRLPLMNIFDSFSFHISWDNIMGDILQTIKAGTWMAGNEPYRPEEAQIGSK